MVGWIGSAIIAIDEIIETTGAPSFHAFLKTAPCKEVLVDARTSGADRARAQLEVRLLGDGVGCDARSAAKLLTSSSRFTDLFRLPSMHIMHQ